MKTKSRNFLITSLTMLVMMLAILFGVVAISPITAYAASSVRVDFCLTNGALENNVFFENDSSKYFMSQQTKADGTLTSLEELYRTDNLDLEFDGWYTEKGEKVSLETVFTEYTILYDRWKPTTLTDEDIISTLEIGTPLLEVGEAAGTYDVNSITLTDNRLSVQSVSVYEGLNAYRTNKLDDSDVLEAGKSYSLRIELNTKSGELIDDQLMNHSTATYGLVANMVYSHNNSGIFTTQWTNRENKIQVIINYDYENYYFTSDLVDKAVENGQSPQYTVYVSNNASIKGMELFVKNANGTWASLGAVTGQFNIPANSNVVKQYRVEVTYQNGFVISSNTFKVDWYDPNAPKFITQPTDYDVAYGTNVLVTWGLNCDVSAIYLEKFDGENYSQYQNATPTGATVNAFVESGTYTFRVHAIKDGDNIYSEDFTITWREKFVFTTQPHSVTVSTGESAIVTWETNLLQTPLQTLVVFQLQTDTGSGWHYTATLEENDTSYDFGASDFAYTQKYRLMANYDGVLYYSDEFTIEYIAGVFTSKPEDTINAIVGKDCLVEWEFNLDVKYYDIKVYENHNFVPFATTDKPEYNFTASEVGEKQFFIQAYNTNDQLIGEDYLLFRINWTEQQIVYLVSFNANNGTGTMQPVEQNAGSQYTLPTCTFTAPDGQIFKAWSVNDVEKQVGDQITINANTVVKAVWKDNLYQVIYQPGEASGNNEIYEYEVNDIITFLDCEEFGYTLDGFEFDYWSIRILGDNLTEVAQKRANETYTLTTNIIAVATWKEIPVTTYDITFNSNGGTGEMASVPVVENGTYELPACGFTAPTGYEFKCWSVNEVEKAVGDEITITADTTVKAVWKAKSYTITFDTNGGSAIDAITQDYGTAIVAPANPTKSGYTFTGWDKTIPSTMPAENMTITAQWTEVTPNTYTVTYTDGVDNVELFADQVNANITEGAATPAFNGTPAREGYTFAGWTPSVAGTVTANATYTATWTINQYTITFDTNGGSAIDPITQNYGTAIVAPANPTKSGYTFTGWDKTIPSTMPAENITVTATWELIPVHSHDYGTTWKSDENNHWNECACGDKANVAPHADANNDGKCDVCDYAMGNADNPGGDIEPEKTGLSGGAIAGIAVGSVAVAGLGGFSLFWFVIKKKKFADLIALFKKK